eukprot:CAMPEP_0115065328 /NCGR_PEP_ID=MMETSP0227-20121206/10190_1 /TAXON_ID=89957 /ORGANISM="Polarella glacialis, Strain CCMP 1383" /LENGTH=393 /DNA_ID=CAMNT_0002451105 /DNA_START=44 /DNA_END=1225 /DNA_ORIENTATION=-
MADEPDAPQAFNLRDVTNPGQARPRGGAPLLPGPSGGSSGAAAGAQSSLQDAVGRVARSARRNPKVALGGCCGAALALLVVVLCSLGTLQPTEYGLRYNRVTKQVDHSIVYRSGRHLIGPMSSFLTFPATVQSLEFSNRSGAKAQPLSTRTAEGLALTLHVAFQYHLVQDEVAALYSSANVLYESLYMKIARDVLLKAAANYNAPQYWTERLNVGKDMQNLVNKALLGSHATCTGLQLLLIELPQQYEASIVATQVQKQGTKTRANEQEATVIREKIKVMVAQYTNNITVTLGAANANAMLVTQSAVARASQMKIDAENVAFEQVQKQLTLSASGLAAYQRNFAYLSMPKAQFLFGMSSTVAVLGGGTAGSVVPSPPPSACGETGSSQGLQHF